MWTDDGRTDGRRIHGYSISSPCEPNGSGELKTYGQPNEHFFVDLKLFVANAYSNANALANFAKPMH